MTPGISRAARLRAYVMGGVLLLGLGGVGYRAWALQVDGGAQLRARAARQHARTVEISPPRGEILDARGRPLAITADVDSVWANPREVADVPGTADALAKLLGVDVATLEARLSADRHFTWLSRHVSPEVAAAVRAAGLTGVEISPEPRRWYPGGAIGGPVIGRSNIDGAGTEGIELAMDELLAGRRASTAALRDARGRTIATDGLAAAEAGATVRLTLDRTIQEIADQALGAAVRTHKAKAGVAVVLDVETGAVLAMSSSPTFDPNEAPEASRRGQEGPRNRAITDAYEIGSSMKVFAVAAALDAGLTRPDEWWDVENGSFFVAGKTIRDVHHDSALTTAGIIKRSSNVGAVKIALRLGRERLGAALQRYGFGAPTGIELPGEVAGRIRDPQKWREIELATVSYGYGLTVTPLQLAAAIATIGRGGDYRAPRVVQEIVGADGRVLYAPPDDARPAMKAKTAAALLPMLGSVFEGGKQGGTAASIVVPGFACGGKTGTAHKWDAAARQYAPDKYYSSFVGLAPIEAPRLAIVVMIDEPRGGDYYGGKVAGPVFATIASQSLRYLGVPGRAIEPTAAAPGADAAEDDEPAPPARPARDAVPVPVDDGVPDLRGLGLRRALDLAAAASLEVEVEGTGRVVGQTLTEAGRLRLLLTPDARGERALPSE